MTMTNNNTTRIAFFGTPEFSATILEKLIATSTIDIVAVVTNPDRPAGRSSTPQPSAVAQLAQHHHLDLHQPERADETRLREALEYLQPDLYVVAAYGFILPELLLDIPRYGALNVHPSLLPVYRGPSPIAAAIDAGERETGVTIMLMDEMMDHGPIVAQDKESLEKDDTTATLEKRLAHRGATLLVETIPRWVSGAIDPQEQRHDDATYTKLLTKNNGHIDWSESANAIERHIRALQPWPGAWSYLPNGKRLKILDADDHPRTHPSPPDIDHDRYEEGTIIKHNGNPAVVTGNGILTLLSVQVEGKQPMSGKDFLNGYNDLIGQQLHPAQDRS